MKNLILAFICLLLAVPCGARTITVDDDGPADFNNIQAAIDVAVDGDEVIIADGNYTGPGNRDIDFLGKAITVRSTDPNDPNIVAATIIDCNGTKTEPHRGFCFRSNEDGNSVLDGLTIINGFAPESAVFLEDSKGGAIMCNSSSPNILNCIIISNKSEEGGGIYCYEKCPIISNCVIGENIATKGGGILVVGGDPRISRCLVKNNSAEWCGGIYCIRSNVLIKECLVINNSCQRSGGGIRLNSPKPNPSWPKVESCIIQGNMALCGAGVSIGNYTTTTVNNCIIVDNNSTNQGGGLQIGDYYPGSNATITNCTISNNRSDNKGGGIFCKYKELLINGCVLWSNQASEGNEIYLDYGNHTELNYSNVSTGESSIRIVGGASLTYGKGVLYVNPHFVDPDGNDYHLLPTSPCINAGDPNYIPEPNETDLDSNPRIIGGRIDMGAYEFDSRPIADAGPNQVVYAWIDGFADVNLDGSASYDDDNDVLDYYWSWTIDGNDYEANGVSPTIQLPVGEHIIELIVNDGIDDSEPDQVTITVIEPMESRLWIFPRIIRRYSWYRRPSKIMAWLRLPEGITKDQIDMDVPLILYPGGIEATSQYIFNIRSHRRRTRHAIVFAYFDRAELLDAVPENGQVELQVVGQLKSGQYFYGSDTIRIMARRLPHPQLSRRRR